MTQHIPRQLLTTDAVDSLLGFEHYGHTGPLTEDAAVMRDKILDTFGDQSCIPDITKFVTVAPMGSDLAEWFRWACPYSHIMIMADDHIPDLTIPTVANVVYTLTITDEQGGMRARRFYAASYFSHLLLRCQFLCFLSAYDLLPPCYPT